MAAKNATESVRAQIIAADARVASEFFALTHRPTVHMKCESPPTVGFSRQQMQSAMLRETRSIPSSRSELSIIWHGMAIRSFR